jgi:hypothetical protein
MNHIVRVLARVISQQLTERLASNRHFINFVHKSNEHFERKSAQFFESLHSAKNQTQKQQSNVPTNGFQKFLYIARLYGQEFKNEIKSLNPFARKK